MTGKTLDCCLVAIQPIVYDKCNHTTCALTTTLNKPTGEANTYILFVYFPQIICNHTWGEVSGSMNADSVTEEYTGPQWEK